MMTRLKPLSGAVVSVRAEASASNIYNKSTTALESMFYVVGDNTKRGFSLYILSPKLLCLVF